MSQLSIEKPLKDYLAGAKFRDLKIKNKEYNNTILIWKDYMTFYNK